MKGTKELEPAYRDQEAPQEGQLVELWTDGSAMNNGRSDVRCAAGVWSEEKTYRASMKVPGKPQSNNRGEIAAVVKALQMVPTNRPVLIRTDSTYVLNLLDTGHKVAEDKGWLHTLNADLFQGALYLIRVRTAPTYIQKVKAHLGILGNEIADTLAKCRNDGSTTEPDGHDHIPRLIRRDKTPNKNTEFNKLEIYSGAGTPDPITAHYQQIDRGKALEIPTRGPDQEAGL
ncbi:RNA-DNA hybrid ribonuclease [Tulasnella sp. 408]|nr:RNA-DNA hybrid ribonuclease [Tulasnella sp. 408]